MSNKTKIDLSNYINSLSFKHKILRLLWTMVWFLFAKPFPRSVGNKWKLILLRIFGAKIHPTAVVYSSVKVYAPWNLVMKKYSCLAPEVDCYNVDKIEIGESSTVSQKTYLCTASHDITKDNSPLITAPIIIENEAWVGADVYISMGVTIKEGAVVGARSAVFKSVDSWSVVGGNPAKFIKKRILTDE